jgi:hypothetical protein
MCGAHKCFLNDNYLYTFKCLPFTNVDIYVGCVLVVLRLNRN